MGAAAERLVYEIMRREFAAVLEDDRLDRAAEIMKQGRVRHLPVLSPEGRLVGILSNRDLLEASLATMPFFDSHARPGFLHSVAVSQVMTREVETIEPTVPLGAAASQMIHHRIGCLPVVKPDGTMIGLVLETDLLIAAYLPEAAARLGARPGPPAGR